MEKHMKIEFGEGCFDGFDGTQEELDELITRFKQLVEEDMLEEFSSPITEEELEELENISKNRRLQ